MKLPMRVFAILLAVLAIMAGAWYFLSPAPMRPLPPQVSQLPDSCREVDFESISYIICEADPSRYEIDLYLKAPDGKPYHDLKSFTHAQVEAGTPVLLAMNAGMYHEDLSPVGLYVAGGLKTAPLQQGEGAGNFFLKPNGVFYLDKAGRPGVLESGRFADLSIDVVMATQSGPMLVIDGAIHPKFEPNGVSRNIRNGVGVTGEGHAVFVISQEEVSFGSFARLFRDELKCPNALYFDGVVSALSNGTVNLVGGAYPAGPIVAVRAKQAETQ